MMGLLEILTERKGAYPLTITTETRPRAKSPLNGQIVKKAIINGFANINYEGAVNRQRTRENVSEAFRSRPRASGEHVQGSPLIVKGKKHYLQIKVEKVLEEKFFIRGREVSKESVQNFLIKSRSSRQKVAKKVEIRDFLLENIKSVTLNGVKYDG